MKNATNYWRKVLRRIVDVTITLATNNLLFGVIELPNQEHPKETF